MNHASNPISSIETIAPGFQLPLESDRLNLRNYRDDDWERIHLYAAVPEFSQYDYWGPNSIEDSKNYARTSAEEARHSPRFKFNLAVCLKDSDLLIGGCGIVRETERSRIASIGWAINPEFQNRGIASEAGRCLIDFGFNVLGIQVIYATCDSRNTASIKVMEKIGMKRVGHTIGNRKLKGHVGDTLRYEIVRAELA